MKCLVVIANYRVTQLTIDCLHSLADEVGRVPGLHVAVCENGTGDEAAERLKTEIEDHGWGAWCTLTVVQPNLGFTGGNNIVIRPALQSDDPPHYVLLLNADTIVRPNAIKILIDFMDEHPSAGIAGSRLEDPDGTPQCSAFRFPSALSEFAAAVSFGPVSWLLSKWIVAPPVRDDVCETDWLSGASLIVRRQVFNDIGLLDEDYFTFFEDVDFCYNARKAGWSCWYVPQSRIVHLVGQSTGMTAKMLKPLPTYSFEARRRLFLKNYGAWRAAMVDLGRILGLSLWRLRVLFGKPDITPPHYLFDSIRHSVFLTGFKLKKVKNPALAGSRIPVQIRSVVQRNCAGSGG